METQSEGKQHPDRNAQFEHINAEATKQMRAHNPVISVNTKKKELVGNYKNGGEKWCRKGKAPQVNSHDFPDPDVPRAHPYGIYDPANNTRFLILPWMTIKYAYVHNTRLDLLVILDAVRMCAFLAQRSTFLSETRKAKQKRGGGLPGRRALFLRLTKSQPKRRVKKLRL